MNETTQGSAEAAEWDNSAAETAHSASVHRNFDHVVFE